MAFYESVFILRQDITTAQVEALAATFADIVRTNGGEVTKTEQWGLRNLAYRIKKNRKGHYVMFNIDAPTKVIPELERHMRMHEDVLRYLTVKVEELEAGPSAMLKRDDRDGERSERSGGDRFDRGSTRRDGSGRPPRHSETIAEEISA